ncbi:molybdopterin-containing oxidoreductase family iron-sulfur binding subunit [Lewinella marina]|uniref:4Fe-4S ferredoxin n=1 Tax=Neolewinella marina TaxID=438751 RepID=A0A2G0CIJ1_9BACT|nr:TAT-variant-translocated molybdopterin oxidoreductase [Neolewinella marina]NJB85052.1 molybdopterin-containing oxidoreductase family iron-sulfur binding subunit [Neolewinella marina]PHK99804.1 4Fe-4S ferredoxin [Neolewinella marina]
MKKQVNNVWIGTDQLENSPEFRAATDGEVAQQDFENPRLEATRRDFLKYLGFGMTAATIASCDIPVRKAIPYVSKPDTIVPGVATYFASTFVQGGDYVPVLVKTREGRPIKIEGNSMSPITEGGTSARAQASVLSIYDTSRFDGPFRVKNGQVQRARNYADNDSWEIFDGEISDRLKDARQIRILSHTLLSPSTKAAIRDFKNRMPGNTVLVQYDPVSSSALLDAHQTAFGIRAIPHYRFDNANVIVGFNCDFLGTWISPVEYARQYATGRRSDSGRMSRHIQVESHMSLTGSNADNRIMVKPSQQGQALLALYNAVVGGGSRATLDAATTAKIEAVARELKNARGAGLVVSGSNNLYEQQLVLAINRALGSYGSTIETNRWSYQRQGSDQDMARFVEELESGGVDALIVLDGANPAYDNPWAARISAALERNDPDFTPTRLNADEIDDRSEEADARAENDPGVDADVIDDPIRAGFRRILTISMSGIPTETSQLCEYITPNHHYLESWSDAEAVQGVYSLIQPAIVPIFASVNRYGTRQEGESLLIWAGETERYDANVEQPYMQYVMDNWKETAFAGQNTFSTFRSFWDSALHDGVFNGPATGTIQDYGLGYGAGAPATAPEDEAETAATAVLPIVVLDVNEFDESEAVRRIAAAVEVENEITFYETINMGNGVYATNPWLQECPDPVTRTVWGNYLTIPVSWAGGNSYTAYKDLNGEEYKGKADLVEVSVNDQPATVTVVRQFGQMPGTFGLALGYGRRLTGAPGRALGQSVGVNVYPWLSVDENGYVQYYTTEAAISDRVGVEEEFASVQYHHTMGLTTSNEEGTTYYDKRTGDTQVIAGELTDEQREHLEPYHVDEATVMEIGEGMQGGLTDRSIIYEGTFANLPQLKEHIAERRAEAQHLNEQTLYPYEEYVKDIYSQGHWWAMHVDLTACIGCAACEVACVAENNVPVVGKYEVSRHHEMKWLRIDRYFYGDVENPRAVYQPMMCQHCDNAPCENVCPVNATQHSDEGANQMIYNRCIGTRYCANNCPYKVRRFNWLDYTTADLFSSNEPEIAEEELPFGADNLTRMVLNPDVTVRSRGVIEKCSFCAQRLQSGKLTAKIEKRALRDSDVRTACQTACPTGAITFGDRNNAKGDVRRKLDNPLNYLALEEVNTQSSVFYAARVHNPIDALEA